MSFSNDITNPTPQQSQISASQFDYQSFDQDIAKDPVAQREIKEDNNHSDYDTEIVFEFKDIYQRNNNDKQSLLKKDKKTCFDCCTIS